ncbi:MAG: flavin reductase family protein [Anaerostipes sp.]|nr:flavin reductase family protein [Anaerostipes sp.]
MKKNIGSALALYPTPVTVIGAMNGENPTWTLVAHIGIIGHDRVLVSLAAPHHINHLIKEGNKLSINIVDEKILPKADSEVFDFELGEEGTPIIKEAPLAIECKVEDIYNTQNFESFICSISGTYVEEEHLNEEGKVNYNTLKPVLFEFPTYEYLKTGEVIGKCLSFKE